MKGRNLRPWPFPLKGIIFPTEHRLIVKDKSPGSEGNPTEGFFPAQFACPDLLWTSGRSDPLPEPLVDLHLDDAGRKNLRLLKNTSSRSDRNISTFSALNLLRYLFKDAGMREEATFVVISKARVVFRKLDAKSSVIFGEYLKRSGQGGWKRAAQKGCQGNKKPAGKK
ncbi:MAG: hypothetical protein ACOC6K_02050 [Thermodesulfobacteriota bacterium]